MNSPNTHKGEEFRQTLALLVIACVFTGAGGYLDAYSYLAHNHVFANAQTGNFVLFAVYASGGQWEQAALHVPSIAAFALGVAGANLLGVRSQKRTYRATLLCQAIELFMLIGLAVTGNLLPEICVVPIISFVAALQVTSFGKIGPYSFNSAMTTGNFRDATTGLVLWMKGCAPEENRGKAIKLGLICLSFLLGALCGGICTRRNEKHALLPCAGVVAIGFLLTYRERRRRIVGLARKPVTIDL